MLALRTATQREVTPDATARPRFESPVLLRLVRLALPLGLVMLLLSLNSNLPRYVIEQHLGERESGIFAALGYVPILGIQV